MVQIEGKYVHYKSENLDAYLQVSGVPFIPRKLICNSNPTLEFSKSDDGEWAMKNVTTLKTFNYIFKLGQEYEESNPGATLKCTTTLQGDNTLSTTCVASNGRNSKRSYVFSDGELVVSLCDDESQIKTTRHYKRI